MRERLKRLARGAAAVCVVPALVSFAVRSRLFGADRSILGSSQVLSLLPGLLGQYLRAAFYSRTLESFHPTVSVGFGTLFSRVGARIGENVYIGPMCHLGLVDIERDVLLAASVHVPSGPRTHGVADASRPIREQPGQLRQVRIGEGSWIGSAAVVLADVGMRTIVASGSVVTKPLPDLVVAAGVPAKIIRRREGA